jgi:hypothetical protein
VENAPISSSGLPWLPHNIRKKIAGGLLYLKFLPYLGAFGTLFELAQQNTIKMRFILYTLSTLLLLLAANEVQAQSLIYYQNTRSEAFLAKQQGGGPAQGVIDHFIDRLATSAGKPASRVEFIVTHDEYVRLTKVSSTQYDVYVTLGNMRLTGDIQYRGFSMAEQLVPTGVQFKFERVNKAGQVIERVPFENVALSSASTLVANYRATDTTGLFPEQTARLGDKQFLYAKEAKGAFDQRIILIDDYYASIPKMEALKTDFQKINPDDFERIEAQQSDLNQLINRLNTIGGSNFPQNLNLATLDPAGYSGRFQQLNATAQDLNARIQKTKNEIPERYHQRGLSFLQQNKFAEANNDFTQAVRLRPTFAPAHLELARLRYREGDIAGAKAKLITIFKDCQPDDLTRQAATQLGTTLYQNHIGNADYAIKQKKFSNGLQSLGEARSLCTDLKLTCTPQLDELTTLAHGGIFQSKLDTARLSLQASNFEDAEKRADDALAYQKVNATYIKDPLPAVRVQADAQTRIYQRTVANANALATQSKLKEAEAEARKAIAYQASHTAAIAEGSAAKSALDRIMDLQYKDNITQAKALTAQKLYRQALPLLDEAIVLETKFPVAKDAKLWTMVQSNAKPIILEDAVKGQQLAQANKLTEARTVTKGAQNMAAQYKLQDDPEVAKALATLTSAIFSQECTNAQNDFENALNEADVQKRLKKFIEASAAYDKGLKAAADEAACGIDTRRAVDGKNAIATAVNYQEMLRDAQTAVDRNEGKKAIETYLNAGQLALSENFNAKFGLQHAPLFDFIMSSGKLEFLRFGAGYFTEKKDLEPALSLLQKTTQMGVSKGLIKDLTKRLGTELALRDRQTEPSSDPKVKAAEYVRGNSKLKGLGKAYLKARK